MRERLLWGSLYLLDDLRNTLCNSCGARSQKLLEIVPEYCRREALRPGLLVITRSRNVSASQNSVR